MSHPPTPARAHPLAQARDWSQVCAARTGPTRRSVLAGMVALAATGCAGFTRSDDLGLDGSVRILNWPDYMDLDLIGVIGDRTAMSISYSEDWADNYAGFDRIANGLETGTPAFDIVVPTNWLAARMHGLNYLQPIPLEVVPNHVNIDPSYLTTGWDRGARFHMPWQAGITGIAYDPAQTGREIRSVSDLFDPEFAGRVGMIGEMREAVGLTMLAAGDDPARATASGATRALERIEGAGQSGQFAGWYYEDFVPALQEGTVALTMAWSGEAASMIAERPDLRFVIPDEGAIRWFDTMVIPQGADAVAGAGKWMNEVYDPATAARITQFVQYISPVLGVRDELANLGGEAALLAENPVLFPDDDTRRRLFIWDGLAASDDEALDDRFAALLP